MKTIASDHLARMQPYLRRLGCKLSKMNITNPNLNKYYGQHTDFRKGVCLKKIVKIQMSNSGGLYRDRTCDSDLGKLRFIQLN